MGGTTFRPSRMHALLFSIYVLVRTLTWTNSHISVPVLGSISFTRSRLNKFCLAFLLNTIFSIMWVK